MTCPICNGTGFYKGKICTCISGKDKNGKPTIKDEDAMEYLKSIFGMKDDK